MKQDGIGRETNHKRLLNLTKQTEGYCREVEYGEGGLIMDIGEGM